MTPTYAIDGDGVVNAATQYAGTPYQKLDNAWQGAQNATLSPLAFGLVGSAVVQGDYESSRSRWETELKHGVDKWIDVIKALNKVAKTHHAAEQASTPNADGAVIKAASGDFSMPDLSSSRFSGELGALVVTWGLLIENLTIGAILASASAMAPAAIIATVAWAAFSPMDGELNHATSLWGVVERNLGDFQDALTPGTNILNTAWPAGQPNRTAFDNFMYQFNQEVDDAKAAATTNKGALDKLNSDLSQIQQSFLIEAIGVLVMMIASQALAVVPFVGPIFEALVQALGTGLAGVTTGTVGVIALAIATSGKQLLSLAGDASFAGAAPASDDHPPSFQQVKISWDNA